MHNIAYTAFGPVWVLRPRVLDKVNNKIRKKTDRRAKTAARWKEEESETGREDGLIRFLRFSPVVLIEIHIG